MPMFNGFKVVETDNFGGDYPNEKFVGPVSKGKISRAGYAFHRREDAQTVADAMNKVHGGDNASRYWKVVEASYTLVPGFTP